MEPTGKESEPSLLLDSQESTKEPSGPYLGSFWDTDMPQWNTWRATKLVGTYDWSTWLMKRSWGNRFVQPKKKGHGRPCCCWLEDGAKLFLNANNGNKTRGNEHILGQDEIIIISNVKGSRRQSPGQCNLIKPPLSNGFGLDDLQQSLIIGVPLWTSGKIYLLLFQDIFSEVTKKTQTG